MSSASNPKYLSKLGLVRNTIKQVVIEGEDVNEEKLVDELAQMIREGVSIKEFVFNCKNKLGEDIDQNEKDADLDVKFDFNIIGSKGWSCLHAGCSSGNTEIVEFLLVKK
jgi:hypothetical protein